MLKSGRVRLLKLTKKYDISKDIRSGCLTYKYLPTYLSLFKKTCLLNTASILFQAFHSILFHIFYLSVKRCLMYVHNEELGEERGGRYVFFRTCLYKGINKKVAAMIFGTIVTCMKNNAEL